MKHKRKYCSYCGGPVKLKHENDVPRDYCDGCGVFFYDNPRGMWDKAIDIYMALELERRMMLFFDKAAYYIARGFEKG